ASARPTASSTCASSMTSQVTVSVVGVRVLLVSTYELGHQPLHVASPAGALAQAGHDARCLDLSVQRWDELAPEAVDWAEAVAFSVPMQIGRASCREGV